MKFDTVAIIGVGLIGGSLGMALLERKLARRVIGVGRRQSTLNTARRRGAISSGTTNLARGVSDAELVVVCTPVGKIVEHVCAAAEHGRDDVLITDAGSTKAEIVKQVDGQLPGGARFVGSHPMAGGEQSGPQFADPELFEDRTVVITPGRRGSPADCRTIREFWSALGARVFEMSPAAHDRCVAAISHVPHIVASVLAASTSDKDLPQVASGWLDTTRIAAGDVQIWMDILRSNRGPILKSLRRFERLLASLDEALESEDDRKLTQILKAGKTKRDAAP